PETESSDNNKHNNPKTISHFTPHHSFPSRTHLRLDCRAALSGCRYTRPARLSEGTTNSVNPSRTIGLRDSQQPFSGLSKRIKRNDPFTCTCTCKGSTA